MNIMKWQNKKNETHLKWIVYFNVQNMSQSKKIVAAVFMLLFLLNGPEGSIFLHFLLLFCVQILNLVFEMSEV
jgi:hypothetical protein